MAEPQPTPYAQPNSHIGRLPKFFFLNSKINVRKYSNSICLARSTHMQNLPRLSSAAKHTGYNISAIRTDVTVTIQKKKNKRRLIINLICKFL